MDADPKTVLSSSSSRSEADTVPGLWFHHVSMSILRITIDLESESTKAAPERRQSMLLYLFTSAVTGVCVYQRTHLGTQGWIEDLHLYERSRLLTLMRECEQVRQAINIRQVRSSVASGFSILASPKNFLDFYGSFIVSFV